MVADPKQIPVAKLSTRDEPATWRDIEMRVRRLREVINAERAEPVAPMPGVETIVSRVLVRPRYLNGYTLADFLRLNDAHLHAYYDAQCAYVDDGEVMEPFDLWARCQFDLAQEFRDECADDDRDPTPHCSYGHRTAAQCDCGDIAENE